MGIIDVKGKWDLEKNTWCYNPSYADYGRSFALTNYEEIINNPNKGIDYVIFAYGCRVEDCSKDFINIKETMCSANKILDYFKKGKKNVVVQIFLMDADAPIKEDAKLLAGYIDILSAHSKTNSINFIGLSKCGAMSFYIPRYFQKKSSFDKTNIFSVASPFNGTKMASPKILNLEIKKFIISKFGNNKFADAVYEKVISIYEGVSSNSHMDYDIAMLGGIPDSKLHLYDESFIGDMFSNENIAAIKKISTYQNLVTGIDDKTMSEALKTLNFAGIGLCVLDDLFFESQSDGFVTTSSQRVVEQYLDDSGFKSYILTSSHHAVGSNNRVFNEILHIVDDTIDFHNDRAKYRARKPSIGR